MSQRDSDVGTGEGESLAQGTVRGTMWNGATFMISRGVLLLVTMLLARILVPDDFGLMALGLLFITYLDALGDLGVGPAIIYRQRGEDRDANTGLMVALASAVTLAAFTIVTAPWVAQFFGEPRATDILRVLAIAFLFDMLSSVHEARLQRKLAFEKRFVPEVSKTAAKGALSVALAVAGFGVWSLVWGQLAGSFVAMLLYWRRADWDVAFEFDRETAKGLLRFGIPITLLGILSIVIRNVDYIIIGRRLDSAALGYYTIAFRLPELLMINFCYIVSQALFPSYSKLQTDTAGMQGGFLWTLRAVAVVMAPVGVGLALVAPEVVTLFFGEQWEPAILVARFLAIYGLFYSLSFNVGDVFAATGRTRLMNILAVGGIVFTFPILWFGADYGIEGVAAGMVIAAAVVSLVDLVVAARLLELRLFADVLRQFLPAATATAVMAAAVAGVQFALGDAHLALRLVASMGTGAVVYGAALWVVTPDTVRQLLRVFTGVLRRRGKSE